MFLVGIGMFGIILYTPLFVQGVLGKTATGSGTVLTPLVFSMTAVGIVGGQIIARVRRVKPFTLVGTVVMTCGVYLLTTLDTGSSQGTVALFLMITGLGLGLIMPTATLAVQTTVDKTQLGVATSATQFIRSIGSTVGTAVVGSIVTKGYAEDLAANAPARAPGRLVSALENPQALVSDAAREALVRAASAFPGGAQLVEQVIQTARRALSDSIHDGFVFILFAVGLSIAGALVMKNIRLEEEPSAVPVEQGEPVHDAALIPTLADALRRDAVRGSRDEALAAQLASVRDAITPSERKGAAVALQDLADRIESGDGDYPQLTRAAADLVDRHGDDEHERALHVSRAIIRRLAESYSRVTHTG
jgi:MFS family permease